MKTNRRKFLKTAAATASAVAIVPRRVLGGSNFVPPSETVNIALVGAGGQGCVNLRALFPENDARVIAVADPAESFSLQDFYYKGKGGRSVAREMIEKHYAPKTPGFRCSEYEDFRVMLENEEAVDAVLCATPDHLHAYVSAFAIRAGKHVFCEKPLTHNIWEARLISRLAKEKGVATQMGNIGHSSEGIRQTCEWLWDGAIGAVREVHAWVGATRWNKTLTGRPAETPPPPAGLNWDLWLGPRESRPYHPTYAPVMWRDFWAFGGGAIGDFVCHDLDAACWALDLRDPLWVEARPGSMMNEEISPHGELCYWQFGQRGNKPPVRVTWYDGGLRPALPDEWPEGKSLPGRGALFIGDKGLLFSGFASKPLLLPEEKNDAYKEPAKTLPRSKGHHRDWLDACKGGPPASSNFEYGAQLTELLLLGILSLRTGKRINWDAANMKAGNLPDADAIIKESYRKGWEVA